MQMFYTPSNFYAVGDLPCVVWGFASATGPPNGQVVSQHATFSHSNTSLAFDTLYFADFCCNNNYTSARGKLFRETVRREWDGPVKSTETSSGMKIAMQENYPTTE